MTPLVALSLTFALAAQDDREAEMFGDDSATAGEEKAPGETAREGPDEAMPEVSSPDQREFAPPNEGGGDCETLTAAVTGAVPPGSRAVKLSENKTPSASGASGAV